MIQQTSVETYHKIMKQGLLSDKRMKVYQILYENPDGLTGTQVSQIFKSRYPSSKTSETIRNRITELKYMGVVAEVGVVMCENSQNLVTKFCTTDNIPEKFKPKATLNERINAVLKSVENFATNLNDEQKKELRVLYRSISNLKKK